MRLISRIEPLSYFQQATASWHVRLTEDMTLADERSLLAIQLLIEGNSLSSTERITNRNLKTHPSRISAGDSLIWP
jgi:hypothetical protein